MQGVHFWRKWSIYRPHKHALHCQFCLRLSMSLVSYGEEENRCTVLDDATTNDCKAILEAQLNDGELQEAKG